MGQYPEYKLPSMQKQLQNKEWADLTLPKEIH